MSSTIYIFKYFVKQIQIQTDEIKNSANHFNTEVNHTKQLKFRAANYKLIGVLRLNKPCETDQSANGNIYAFKKQYTIP